MYLICSDLICWHIRKNRCWSHQEHLLPRWWNHLKPVCLIPVVQIRRNKNVYHQQILKSFGQIIDVCIACIAAHFSILPNFCFSLVSNLLAYSAKSKNKEKTTDNRMKSKINCNMDKYNLKLFTAVQFFVLSGKEFQRNEATTGNEHPPLVSKLKACFARRFSLQEQSSEWLIFLEDP